MRRPPALSALLLTLLWIHLPMAQNASGQREGSAPAPPVTAAKLPVRWWRDAGIAADVSLTRAQTDRIDAVFEDFLKPQRERWDAFRPLEKQLDDLLRQPYANEKQVIDLITRLEDRRSELSRNRLIMLFHIQQVLDQSQRTKLQELGWSAAGSPIR